VVIDQRGKRFIPRVTAVTPGTQIEFPNNDSVFHNVYAAFEASTFDLGEYPRGAVKRKLRRPVLVSARRTNATLRSPAIARGQR